jgi:AcrR family transcriptional regulator
MDARDPDAIRSAARLERLRPRREPLQARARARVDAILAATIELLQHHDVEDVTTAAIAKRARVPIGSVYHYFPNKEGVLAELVARTTSRVDDESAASLGRDLGRLGWREAIERAIERSVAAYASDVAYLAVWRATRGTPAFREAATASDERFAETIESLPAVRARLRPQAVRAGIRISNAFLDWALETTDPRARATVVQEMKHAVIAYLAPQLEAAPRRVRTAASKRRSPRRPA